MWKYLIGLASGVLLVPLTLYLFLSPTAFWQSYRYITDDISLYRDSTGVMSGYSYALGKEYSDDPTRFETETLELVEHAPITTLDAADIDRVCLVPTWFGRDYLASYYVQVFLTPDARSRIADILAPHAGKQFSFRLKGNDLSNFILSADRLQEFGAGRLPDNVKSDFEFEVPQGATITGLYYAHILSGGNDFDMCEPTDSLDMIPYYQAFKENIEHTQKEQKSTESTG